MRGGGDEKSANLNEKGIFQSNEKTFYAYTFSSNKSKVKSFTHRKSRPLSLMEGFGLFPVINLDPKNSLKFHFFLLDFYAL